MTLKQAITLQRLVEKKSLVMDRVYFDHETGQLNFRAFWNQDFLWSEAQSRLAILPNGELVTR